MKHGLRIIFSRTRAREGAKGYAALTATILTLVVSLLVVSGFALFALREVRANRIFMQGLEAHAAAESGLEDAVYRLVSGMELASTETFSLGENSIVISIAEDGAERIIRSEGTRSSFQINQEARLLAVPGASFVYGAHAGNGGVLLENTSQIIGSIYSGGDIEVRNSAQITGDAFASGASRMFGVPTVGGDAHAHAIEGADIGRDARAAGTITESDIGRDAYADIIQESDVARDGYYETALIQSTVGGISYPGSPAPSDLPSIPFSISDAQIDEWKTQAEAGGVHTSPCPYELSSGTAVLGPLKISCDLVLQNSARVVVTGPLWVVGTINLKNNAVIELDSLYGNKSEIAIADNPSNRTSSSKIVVQNGAQARGSGSEGSYLLLISQNNSSESGGNEAAINQKNSASGSLYYAPHGEILIENPSTLKEVTGYKIHLKNSATLTYESDLMNIKFSSGAVGGFDIRSWQEVE